MDTLEFDLGIVGRNSYAEDCQEAIHNRIGSVDPEGWAHQLQDEPVLNMYFERKWRVLQTREAGGLGFDCIPHMGIAAGNVYTGINLGGQVRFGWMKTMRPFLSRQSRRSRPQLRRYCARSNCRQ